MFLLVLGVCMSEHVRHGMSRLTHLLRVINYVGLAHTSLTLFATTCCLFIVQQCASGHASQHRESSLPEYHTHTLSSQGISANTGALYGTHTLSGIEGLG